MPESWRGANLPWIVMKVVSMTAAEEREDGTASLTGDLKCSIHCPRRIISEIHFVDKVDGVKPGLTVDLLVDTGPNGCQPWIVG